MPMFAPAGIGTKSGSGIQVRLQGADTAVKILKEFDYAVRRRIVTAAVRAGATEIKKEAGSLAPRDTGNLAKQFRVTTRMERATGEVVATIKPKPSKSQRKKGAGHAGRYLHLVVGGTRAHDIAPRDAKSLSFAGHSLAAVHHPGARANPFVDAASRSVFNRALTVFALKFDQVAAKEAAKLRATQGLPK